MFSAEADRSLDNRHLEGSWVLAGCALDASGHLDGGGHDARGAVGE
jgi:hypothetical protein